MSKDFYYIGNDGKKYWLTLNKGSAEWVNFDCPEITWKDGSVILDTAWKWEIKTWWMGLSDKEEKELIKKIIKFIVKSDKAFVKKYGIEGGNLLENIGFINGEKVNKEIIEKILQDK